MQDALKDWGLTHRFAGSKDRSAIGNLVFDVNDFDVNADTFRVGFRYTFGGTLKDRNDSGASLGSVAKLFGAGLTR